MRSTLVLSALTASTVLASPHIVQVRQIAARQDASSIDFATLVPTDISIPTDLSSLIPSGCLPPSDIEAAPTPPPAVISALASVTDVCEEPKITGSASSQYKSYTDALSSWGKENSGKIEDWASKFSTACPYASATENMNLPALTETGWLSLASCSNKATGTGSGGKATGSGTGSAAGAESTGAAAQMGTGFAAAGLIAGFAGVVAAL